MRYWVNTMSRDRVKEGLEGGFTQANHERATGLRNAGAEACRRKVEFLPASEAPIRPLLPSLDFICRKESWGFTFRRGFFEIEAADFERIADAMNVTIRR